MKKVLIALTALLFFAPSLFAVPRLQLYIDGATYDDATETWVTSASTFDLYVIGNGTYDEVFVSMALEGLGELGDPSGSGVDVNGVSYPTGSWTWGYAPLSNVAATWNGGQDLPKHDIYPAWYTEFSAGAFSEVGGIGDVVADSAAAHGDPYWLPTDGYIPGGNHLGEYKKFTVSVSGAYGVHFDAYTIADDGTIEYFAPFSHDASYGGKVPEPATMLLFGIGLAGTGIVRRLRKKA